MTSLYHRLFKYRARQARSPLEDFLSEALADLLNRLPEATAREAAAYFMQNRPEAVHGLEQVWPIGAASRWVTQKAIEGGRLLDLLLEVAGRPVLVVENKIGAGFQEHIVAESPDPPQHQLATYGHWLSREADPNWGGAIVLLTHWTPGPADFGSSSDSYGSRHQSTIRWADLSRWLGRLVQRTEDKKSTWTELTGELILFLKEHGMDSEIATGRDLAALQIYVSSADRVRNSITQIWESARNTWRPICQQAHYPVEYSTEYGCVWMYRYLAKSDFRSCYLAVGLRYPAISEHPHYADPDGEQYLFVELGSDQEASPINDLELPTPWAKSDNLRLARRPLRDLSADPEQFLAEAKAWASERIAEAARLVG